jgi:hypothetical protein
MSYYPDAACWPPQYTLVARKNDPIVRTYGKPEFEKVGVRCFDSRFVNSAGSAEFTLDACKRRW